MDLGAQDLLGFGISLAVIAGIAVFVSTTRLPQFFKILIYVGLGLRVVGAVARYVVLFGFYDGVGDAVLYYEYGLTFAEKFWSFDFSPFYDSTLWLRGNWSGTAFIPFPSGVVLALTGPSLLGEFVVFSLLAFLGLWGFVMAFKHTSPGIAPANYSRWVWLFPSLWFWPSSVGKDALILMGIGLATWGLFGPRGRRNWVLIGVGLFFVMAIRPQVAAVFLLSVILAQWLSLGGGWSVRRIMQGVTIVVVGVGGIVFGMRMLGVNALDLEEVQGYVDAEVDAAVTSGSAVEEVGVSITSVPEAILNILARPFPWEATNVMAFASALEIFLFWGLVWYRRRNVWTALRSWRTHPLVRVAVPFILIYSATLGMVVYNLGIIARQRIFLFPFLFLLLEAIPEGGTVPARGGGAPAGPPRVRRTKLTLGPAAMRRSAGR